MAIVIYDPYPVETNWRNSIAEIDTPLHQLEYGIMSESISEKVINIHKNNRHNKVVKLIKKIHNDRLDDVWREIISDAKKLPNYKNKNWVMGRKNKSARVKFFEKNDISIQYLEEAIEVQMGGNPEFLPGDLVFEGGRGRNLGLNTYQTRACIIREKINRGKFYYADLCTIEWVSNDSDEDNLYSNWSSKTLKPKPIWHRYHRVNPKGGGKHLIIKVDSWKCVKVGVETSKIRKDRNDAIDRYNKELLKRNKFYKDIIKPLLEPNLCLSYTEFHNQKIDVWKITKPPRCPTNLLYSLATLAACRDRLIRWNTEWEIIIDNIHTKRHQ